jgi:parallel beta-helix repeat protein
MEMTILSPPTARRGTHLAGNSDRNGIELDQWTNNDTISANTVCGNDGGIVVYDARDNSISGNIVFANSADSAASVSPSGEIVLVSSNGLTANNTNSGNVFMGISAYAPVLLVDATSSTSNNVFSGNAFEDFGALAMYDWVAPRAATQPGCSPLPVAPTGMSNRAACTGPPPAKSLPLDAPKPGAFEIKAGMITYIGDLSGAFRSGFDLEDVQKKLQE